MSKGPISQFIEKYYLHFNSATVVDGTGTQVGEVPAVEKQKEDGGHKGRPLVTI